MWLYYYTLFPGWPVNLQYSFGSFRDPPERLKSSHQLSRPFFLVLIRNDLEFLDFHFSHGSQGLFTSTTKLLKDQLNLEFMNYNNVFLNIKDSNLIIY